MAKFLAMRVQQGKLTIEEVPAIYREAVIALLEAL